MMFDILKVILAFIYVTAGVGYIIYKSMDESTTKCEYYEKGFCKKCGMECISVERYRCYVKNDYKIEE